MASDNGCGILGGVCDVIGGAVNNQVANMAKDMINGSTKMFTDFYTSWTSDAPMPVLGGETGAWMSFVLGNLQILLMTLGLIVAGTVTMFQANHEPGVNGLIKFFRAVLIQLGGTALIIISVKGAQGLATWILAMANKKTTPTDLIGSLAAYGENYTFALMFGAITAILVAIQWGIVIFRSVALTVVTPYWPVAASLGMFNKFEDAFDRVTKWIIAYILYSPIAASMYGLALVLKSGVEGMQGVIYGIIILVLAIAVMPALMKLVAPVASAVGSASAAGVAWAAGKMVVLATAAVGATVLTAGAAAPAAGAAATAGTAGGTAAAEGAAAGGTVASVGGEAAAGSAGAAGSSGSAGSSGGQGATGAGRVGGDGADGVGSAGADGANGADGVDGSAGVDGSEGAQGADGRDGTSGSGFAGQLANYMGQVGGGSVEDAWVDEEYRR